MAESSTLDALRARLTGLSEMLAGGAESAAQPPCRPATAAAPPAGPGSSPRQPRQFQSTVRPGPTPAVLCSSNSHARDAPLGGLLHQFRAAEANWLKEKGKLVLAAKAEQQRRAKAEAELRRAQQQLAFRVGEVKHLKQALKGRDGELQELQDRLREYELAEGGERMAQETVQQAEAERDELRAAMQATLERLDDANAVISQADASMGGMEAQVAAAAAAQQQAEASAAAARAEAEQLRETVADLQFKVGLLQQLTDLTLKQNDEKTVTLRQLLESESLLDAEDSGSGGAASRLPPARGSPGCWEAGQGCV